MNSNFSNIREQIRRKNSTTPFMATEEDIKKVKTRYDQFPYRRWFNGIPQLHTPIIPDREAGLVDYKCDGEYHYSEPIEKQPEFNPCFQSACSTYIPCQVYKNNMRITFYR